MQIRFFGASALAMALAAPAAAVQPVTITSAGIYNPGSVDATIGGNTVSQYSVPLTFTAANGSKPVADFLGFCVDLAHVIYVNIGSQLSETLGYHVAPLTQDGFGNALSSTQVREITGLARLGFSIAGTKAIDAPAQLAAIQQAIWTIEYPTSTFVATGPYAAAQTSYTATFLAAAPHLSGFARAIVSDSGTTQGQITNVGGVPEPAAWALMLAGFGMVGVLARGRRGGMQTVAA